jgi:hypothetical protein
MVLKKNVISSKDYIIETAKRTRAIWLGNLNKHDMLLREDDLDTLAGIFQITKTTTCRYTISTNKEWMKFVNTCYSLSCIQCGNEGWKTISGRKRSIEEWLNEEVSEKLDKSINYSIIHSKIYIVN